MKKQPNAKVFMGLTALTLLVGMGLAFFQYSALQDNQARVAKLRKDSLDETQLDLELKSSLAKLQDCSARLNHLEKGVPELEYVPTMLKELETIGKESGLDVLGVRPVPKAATTPQKDQKEQKSDKKKYTEVDIEVTCRGNYEGAKSFVRALQSFPKIVAARTVSLTPRQENKNGGAPTLDITIDLRSYLFPPDKSEMKKAADVNNEAAKEANNAA